ncbi:hypothetical protein J2Y03_004610 [Neobacillus niacini]|uniref:hypothetical protein n=1 Tax=Neobacillus niacini TaxID=86668 RepID=UPI00285DE944|nr:hypothetical protein [Neobacillus niacini]MDR7079552.1 hypothetical protein [Neobacillus niacini]
MLAEIQGKISQTGSNLSDRLEDNLTGNVFGALRYIPFSIGFGEVIANGVYPKSIGLDIRSIHQDFWADKINFWPYDREGEIDALIEFEDLIMGIEVKYKSGLSSDDEVSNNIDKQNEADIHNSINQLARESRIIARKGKHKNKLLLFIADRRSCKEVYEDIIARDIIENDVVLGYISWQEILLQLKNLQLTNPFHQIVVQDIISLLTRKGFEDFTTMDIKLCEPINDQDYFKFDIQSTVSISFEANLAISEGFYYEFSR